MNVCMYNDVCNAEWVCNCEIKLILTYLLPVFNFDIHVLSNDFDRILQSLQYNFTLSAYFLTECEGGHARR